MKLNYIQTICAISLIIVQQVKAQDSVEYALSPQIFSFNITIKSMVGGTFEVDSDTGRLTRIPAFESTLLTYDRSGNLTRRVETYAAKLATARYGNANLLNELAAAGLLGSGGARGWSLLAIADGAGGYDVVARKGSEELSLEDFVDVYAFAAIAAYNSNNTTNWKYTFSDGQIVSEIATMTGSGTYSYEGPASLALNTEMLGELSLSGTMTESGSEFRWYRDSADKSSQSHLPVSRGVRIAGLAGGPTVGGGEIWAAGTASIGAGRAVKVTGQ